MSELPSRVQLAVVVFTPSSIAIVPSERNVRVTAGLCGTAVTLPATETDVRRQEPAADSAAASPVLIVLSPVV
jgi:hypothetical protein